MVGAAIITPIAATSHSNPISPATISNVPGVAVRARARSITASGLRRGRRSSRSSRSSSYSSASRSSSNPEDMIPPGSRSVGDQAEDVVPGDRGPAVEEPQLDQKRAPGDLPAGLLDQLARGGHRPTGGQH